MNTPTKKPKYNSAVGAKNIDFDVFEGIYRSDKLTAFTHDLNKGVHPEFANADVIYSEIPWERGYDKFVQGHTDKGFDEFVSTLREVIMTLRKPAYIIGSRRTAKLLNPHDYGTVNFDALGNHSPSIVAIFFPDKDFKVEHSTELMRALADEYDVILDFCCGYGNAAREFIKKGKKAIISDINGVCIKTAIEEMENL